MLLRIACCALGHKHELSMKHEQEQELKQSLRSGSVAANLETHVLSRKCYCSHSKVFSLIFANSLRKKLRHQRGFE